MPLLNKRLLNSTLQKNKYLISQEKIDKLYKHLKEKVFDRIENKTFKKEEAEKPVILPKFFEFLGYNHPQTFEFEFSNKSRSADVTLGQEVDGKRTPEVAIEWKGIDTKNLDGGKAGETPVSQMWDYMGKMNVEFGIIGNFLEWRLYSKRKGQTEYQEFKLREIVENREKLVEMIFLLSPQTLLKLDKPKSEFEELIDNSISEQEQITKRFYEDYKQRRSNLFHHLIACNKDKNKHFLLEKTQKILDRLIFVLFCEDRFLLPANTFKETFELGKRNRSRSQTKIWEQFQYLFEDIDKGRYDIQPHINAFNGGLFSEDLELNSLVIKDDIWQDLVKFSDYDFESELDVDVLGHIFEQSISDIEEIKEGIENNFDDYTKSEYCSICGLLQDEKPYDSFGCPTHNICPCCGSEFGYEDCTVKSLLSNRQKWIDNGKNWFDQDLKPENWNFEKQFENAYHPPKPKTSKRKKDGIYYTPEYITDYIVSETVGGWMVGDKISFRRITENDYYLYHKWQNDTDVYPTYEGRPLSFEEVKNKLGERIFGNEKDRTISYIFSINEKEAGHIQRYYQKYYLEWNYPYKDKSYDFDTSQGIDIFIGEDEFRNKGYGAKIIHHFLYQEVFSDGYTETCIIDPDPANPRAVKAYKKAWFNPVKEINKIDKMESDAILMVQSKDNFYQKYKEVYLNKINNIKILDPAGGSGAFPNQVFNFLTKKWVQKMNQIAVDSNLETLADFDEISIDKSILKNNIFMVDLQPESVEIAKLSLWLKTARKDQKLNNLDENLKVGNSLISDPELAGDLAFDWEKEFGWLRGRGENSEA
jgi:RimJ/RimL family protein N-acetyltransferase